MTRGRVLLFAFCCGAMVGNLYYAQPIIDLIAPDIGLSHGSASLVVSLTQVGYALGLFFIVPLADLVENRRLLIVTALLAIASLAAASLVRDTRLFLAVSFLVGFGSVAVQILVPLAANLAPEASRGRVVGNVMSGLAFGILLSRPAASFVADHFGWRAVFGSAAVLMTAIVVVFVFTMRERQPTQRGSYPALIASLGTLVARLPVLRQRSFMQGCLFASFTLFWTTVPLELARRYGYSQSAIALFALVGATGAIAAPLGGRIADAGHTRVATLAALCVASVCFLPGLVDLPGRVVVLAANAVVIDFCVSMNMVLGQRAIYALDPESRGRLNALYMTSIFIGGAVGSSIASPLYAHGGWTWIVIAGSAFPLVALAHRTLTVNRHRPTPPGAIMPIQPLDHPMSHPEPPEHDEPGGPYFGRLLIVLFLAVAFCAVLTWILVSYVGD